MAARQLRSLLGVEFSASSTILEFDGTLTARDVLLRVPGVQSEAGELLRADRVIVEMDLSNLHTGTVRPQTIRLHGALCRISVAPDGSMNIDGLGSAEPGDTPPAPPKIDAPGAILELGEHVGSRYTALKTLQVDGSFMPIHRGQPEYVIQLIERVPGDSHEPSTPATAAATERRLMLDGRLNLIEPAATLNLHDLELAEWGPQDVPANLRGMWERLNIRGSVRRSTLTYDPVYGLRVEFHPTNVALDAPIPSGLPDEPDRPLGLTDVNGSIAISRDGIHADLVGLIEGQEEASQVSFTTYGTSLNAAIDCTVTTQNFVIGENPGLLRFMPPVVQRRFEDFSGPTAELDARVRIQRSAPDSVTGRAGEFTTEGSIVLRRARFAHEKFPYELTDLRGVVEFDDHQIEIVNLTGRGPSGARVYATGLIAPPSDEAHVDIQIDAVDVPVDEHLAAALRNRRGALDALFDMAAYEQLRADGLVLSSQDAAAARLAAIEARTDLARLEARDAEPDVIETARAHLASVEAQLRRPVFDPGGRATAQVLITHRPDQDWDTDVHVRFDETVGLLPEPFPLPILASDLALRVHDETVTLLEGAFTTLNGGAATVEASIGADDAGSGEDDAEITISAADVPVDILLIRAIPEAGRDVDPEADAGDATVRATPRPGSIQHLLRSLGIQGTVDAEAQIGGLGDEDGWFDVDVTFDRLAMNPAGAVDAQRRLRVEDASGQIHADNDHVQIRSLSGTLVSVPLRPDEIPTPAGSITLNYEGDFGADAGAFARVRASVEQLDLTAPVEEVIAIVSPEAAATLRTLRSKYQPAGVIDADVALDRTETSDVRVTVAATNGRGMALDTPPGRLNVEQRGGRLQMVFDERQTFRAEDLIADVTTVLTGAEEPATRVHVDGTLQLASGALLAADARAAVVDGRLESGLIGGLIRRAFGEKADDAWTQIDPAGEVDLEATFWKEAGGELLVSGEASPRSLAFSKGGERILLPQVRGRVTFGPDGGVIDRLRIQGEGWTAAFDGGWSAGGDGDAPAYQVQTRVLLNADGLTPAILALAPPRTRQVLEETDAAFDNGLRFHDAEMRLDLNESLAPIGGSVQGVLSFAGLRMDPGVPITDVTGRVNLDAEQVGDTLAVEAAVQADELRVAGVHLLDADVYLRTGAVPGNLVIPVASASCHGGRISARGLISGLNMTEADELRYEADISVTGLRFAPVLAQLDFRQPDPVLDGTGQEAQPMAAAVLSTDESRGLMDATVTLRGVAGDPGSRSGRGALRINGGDVVELPGVMGLLQLSNLQLPSADPLDYLQTEFFLRGDNVDFEHISLLAESLSLVGSGRMNWADKSLNFTFNSMSRLRIPIWSDVFESLRNEIVTTTVRGTISEPDVSTRPLATTGAVIGKLFGSDHDFREGANLQRAEREARAERRRLQAVIGD